MDRFDNLLLAAQQQGSPKTWRDALANVADTALICRAWLEDHAPEYTPADLIAMTRIVVEREAVDIMRQDSMEIK